MVNLRDRMLGRQQTYSERDYSNAYYVTVADAGGRETERVNSGLIRDAQKAYGANGVVFGCVTRRMALISEARFQYQRIADMSLFGDQNLSILEHPWPNATAGELFARVEQHASYAGNAFVRRVDPDDGSDPLLLLMRPDTVQILSEERRDTIGRPYKLPVGYLQDMQVLGINADPQLFLTDEVAHYSPVPDPDSPWRGMSWMTPVLREVGADLAMTSYKTYHLDQGAFPGIVIKSPRKLSDKAILTLRKRLAARYSGPGNAGKTLVLDEGLDATVAGHSLEQLQADLVTKAGERRVCSAADVPLELMGLEQGDYQAAQRRFADMWARPHWRMICACLEHLIPAFPEQGVRLWFDVSGIAALREGELARGQTTLVKSQSVAAFVAAGMTRKSSIAAADSGDISLLVEDPRAPTPGMAGRVTETQKLGPGQEATGQPGTGQPGQPGGGTAGPGGGALNGRAPQAGKPQALPGVVKSNRPNTLPGRPGTMPALPAGGPRGRRPRMGAGKR